MRNPAGSTQDMVLFRISPEKKVEFKMELAHLELSIEAYLNACVTALLKKDGCCFKYLEDKDYGHPPEYADFT